MLVEGLSSLHDEGDAIPSLILDVSYEGTEGWASRVLRDGVVLAVGGLAAVERLAILADDDVLGLNGGNGSEDADLFVTDVLSVE